MSYFPRFLFAVCVATLSLSTEAARAQRPQQIVRAALAAEFAADANDHSDWTYRDHDVAAGKDEWTVAIETPQGSIKRVVMRNGKLLTGADRETESARIQQYVNDPAAQAKRRKVNEKDDEQAASFMHSLPDAYVWSVVSETPETITLKFRPNDNFSPPNMESRVMSAMAGEIVVVRDGNRIRTLRGALSHDVKFGFGILGKMYQGGTFDIERREVGPGHWQITETHVHLDGHALIFKTIGQQEDEVKTDWKPSPAKTLKEAEEYLRGVK